MRFYWIYNSAHDNVRLFGLLINIDENKLGWVFSIVSKQTWEPKKLLNGTLFGDIALIMKQVYKYGFFIHMLLVLPWILWNFWCTECTTVYSRTPNQWIKASFLLVIRKLKSWWARKIELEWVLQKMVNTKNTLNYISYSNSSEIKFYTMLFCPLAKFSNYFVNN